MKYNTIMGISRCLLFCVFCCLNAFYAYCQIDHEVIINTDHSVTFYVNNASMAKKVSVTGNFIEKHDSLGHRNELYKGGYRMKFEGNRWQCTTKSLNPEMYIYRFVVDGNTTVDTIEHQTTRDVKERYNFFFISDSIVDHYIDKDIPHGQLSKVWYPSTLNGMSQRRMFIYTPVGYDVDLETKYPVLYLLHGSGGDETSWSDYGRVCQILDDMIYKKEIAPMIVVMPNGNVNLDAAPGESPYMNKEPSANNVSSMFGQIESHFRKEIVSFVEKRYRTISDKHHRAIAGVSLGGLHTIYISANNPDLFDYVGLFSPQTYNALDNDRIFKLKRVASNMQRFRNVFSIANGNLPERIDLYNTIQDVDIYSDLGGKLKKQFANPPKLYYIAIGKDDFLRKTPWLSKKNAMFKDILTACGYKYEYHLSEGTHSWENWRRYLVDFLPKLFTSSNVK